MTTFRGVYGGDWTVTFSNTDFATKEFFNEFAEMFYDIHSIEAFAEFIGDCMRQGGVGSFLEGVGPVDWDGTIHIWDKAGDEVATAQYEEW